MIEHLLLMVGAGLAAFAGGYYGTAARLRRVEQLLERLNNKTTMVAATTHRVEDAASTAAKHAVEVAEDLRASHERADAVDGPEGAAADAASRTVEPGASE